MTRRPSTSRARELVETRRADPAVVIIGAAEDDPVVFERVARLLAALLDTPAKE